MIHDSAPWKDKLLRTAEWLRKMRLSEQNEDILLEKLEYKILVGWFAIRKLADTFKISDSVRQSKISMKYFPRIKTVDYMNCHKVDELYDLNNGRSELKDLLFVCNQFVHSFVLTPVFDADKLDSFLVASDRVRQDRLYCVGLQAIIEAFRLVGKNYPHTAHMKRDEQTGQWLGTVE